MSRWREKSVQLSSNVCSVLGDVGNKIISRKKNGEGGLDVLRAHPPPSPGVPGPWERRHPVGED